MTATQYDTSGYCGNGVIVNSPVVISTPSPRYHCCTHLGGTGYLSFTQAARALQNSSNYTITMWCNGDQAGVQDLWSISENTYWQFTTSATSIQWRDASIGQRGSRKTYALPEAVKTMTAGEWHHLAIVFSPKKIQFYIDATDAGSVAVPGDAMNAAIDVFYMGKNAQDNTYWHGYLSDVRVYATSLTAQGIQDIYNVSMNIDSNGNVSARLLT